MNKINIFLVCILGVCYSQNVYDVLRPYFGFNSSQILVNSIGGAAVAAVSYTHLTLPTNREV